MKYFKLAVSWGGYESLFEPTMLVYKDGEEVPEDRISLIRVHAGLEDLDLLKDDLAQALDSSN